MSTTDQTGATRQTTPDDATTTTSSFPVVAADRGHSMVGLSHTAHPNGRERYRLTCECGGHISNPDLKTVMGRHDRHVQMAGGRIPLCDRGTRCDEWDCPNYHAKEA